MLLTNEDLLAISGLLDVKLKAELDPIKDELGIIRNRLDALEDRIGTLENRMDALEGRMGMLENRMDALEDRMGTLENRMDALEDRIGTLEDRVGTLESRMDALEGRMDVQEGRMDSMQEQLHKIQLFQENVILPRLNTIESCYIDTYERYQKEAKKIESLYQDMSVVKAILADHSEKLQKLLSA